MAHHVGIQPGRMGLASSMNGCRQSRSSAARGGRPRPVGQAVKTPASHAGNAGSIPARVTIAGVYYAEDPPVPIPNTEVKLSSAEDTWWEAAWENRSMPALVALK